MEGGKRKQTGLHLILVEIRRCYPIHSQVNNAVAVVDLDTDNITAIHGLGFKQWGQFDASDTDGGEYKNGGECFRDGAKYTRHGGK